MAATRALAPSTRSLVPCPAPQCGRPPRPSSGSKALLVCTATSTQQHTSVEAGATTCSPHPDALKRRQEAERARKQRERDRAEREAREASGMKWWEGDLPQNMVAVLTPCQLDKMVAEANKTSRLVLINYFTEDCFTCRTLHPKLKKIASDNPDVLFLKLNGTNDALRPVFHEQGVTKVPWFECVREGKVRSAFSASLSPERLALLRAEIAAHKSPAFSNADNEAYSTMEK